VQLKVDHGRIVYDLYRVTLPIITFESLTDAFLCVVLEVIETIGQDRCILE